VTHALTVGSLFSGIGGIELGLTRCGMELRWLCEIDPFCRVRISRHWPRVPNLGDVRAVGWACVEPVDLVAGGFPCQPVSLAGKRRGVDDERWLWPEFERCLRALRPRFALVENVPGLLVSGYCGTIFGDLAEAGYNARWTVLGAGDVGAPHKRKRLWILAYSESK